MPRRSLAHNTAWMLAGQAARTVIQGIYFILVARSLDPAGYGAFVAASSFVLIGAPFATFGAGLVLIKNVARDPASFPVQWGNSLVVISLSGSALLGVMLAASPLVLPAAIPALLVLALGLSELVLARIAELCGQVFQAFQQLAWTAAIQFLLSVCRLISIAVLLAIDSSPTPLQWGAGYLAATFAAAAAAFATVHVLHGRPRLVVDRTRLELAEGALFSVSLAARTVYNDIDKTMLSRLSSLSASGVYGAAYRVVDLAFTPIQALLSASYARFFQRGADGLSAGLRMARGLLPAAALYGAVAGLGLVFLSPVVSLVLGPSYAELESVLTWLAPLPLLRAGHYFLADALTGAGHQRVRSAVQVLVAAANVLLNLWLIPRYSWVGAAWSSLACDGLLVAGMLAACVGLERRS
jgi:O-antigen/teichoic acid export membrane protein